MAKKIFLSLPMSGRSDEEIKAQIEEMKAEVLLKNPFDKGEEIEFVDNLVNDIDPSSCIDVKTEPLLYLGEVMRKFAYCDGVYFGKGWSKARGCIIEWQTCMKYGIPRYIMLCDGSITKMIDPKEDVLTVVSKGYWFDRGSLSCRCSNCGCKSNKEFAYCPNCGAKMVEPQESEVENGDEH